MTVNGWLCIIVLQGKLGLKKEELADVDEQFHSIERLIDYYRHQPIFLKDGSVSICLAKPHPRCDVNLE